MTKTSQDFTIVAGADKLLRFTVYNAVTGAVVDVTGYTVKWRAQSQRDDTQKILVTGAVQAPGTNGVVTVILDGAATDNADIGRWAHQLWLTDLGANEDCAAEGTFTVREALPAT